MCYNDKQITNVRKARLVFMKNQIEKLKKVKNAVILAHYYAPAQVQGIADYVGDSFYLAKIAK